MPMPPPMPMPGKMPQMPVGSGPMKDPGMSDGVPDSPQMALREIEMILNKFPEVLGIVLKKLQGGGLPGTPPPAGAIGPGAGSPDAGAPGSLPPSLQMMLKKGGM